MRFLTFILASFIIQSAHAAAPFGVACGQPLSAFNDAFPISGKPGLYVIAKVPVPNPLFVNYLITVGQKCGLAQITASGPNIETNEQGDQIKTLFNVALTALRNQYGEAELVDSIASEFVDRPQMIATSWAEAIARKQRRYAAIWRFTPDNSHEHLQAIVLSIQSLHANTLLLTLTCQFDNYSAFAEERPKNARSAP